MDEKSNGVKRYTRYSIFGNCVRNSKFKGLDVDQHELDVHANEQPLHIDIESAELNLRNHSTELGDKVVYIAKQIWKAADINKDSRLGKEEYIQLNLRFCKAIKGFTSKRQAFEQAAEDWIADNEGGDEVNFDQFLTAIIHLCDTWAEASSEEEYIVFFESLYQEIVEEDKIGKYPVLRDLDDIQTKFRRTPDSSISKFCERTSVQEIMSMCFFDHWKMNPTLAKHLGVNFGAAFSDLETTKMVIRALDKFYSEIFAKGAKHHGRRASYQWAIKLDRCRAWYQRNASQKIHGHDLLLRLQYRRQQHIQSRIEKRFAHLPLPVSRVSVEENELILKSPRESNIYPISSSRKQHVRPKLFKKSSTPKMKVVEPKDFSEIKLDNRPPKSARRTKVALPKRGRQNRLSSIKAKVQTKHRMKRTENQREWKPRGKGEFSIIKSNARNTLLENVILKRQKSNYQLFLPVKGLQEFENEIMSARYSVGSKYPITPRPFTSRGQYSDRLGAIS